MNERGTTPVSVQKLTEQQELVDSSFRRWKEAAEQKRTADSLETNAKNALMEAQRRFDDLTARFRQEHNYDDRSTSWSVGAAYGSRPHERKAGE